MANNGTGVIQVKTEPIEYFSNSAASEQNGSSEADRITIIGNPSSSSTSVPLQKRKQFPIRCVNGNSLPHGTTYASPKKTVVPSTRIVKIESNGTKIFPSQPQATTKVGVQKLATTQLTNNAPLQVSLISRNGNNPLGQATIVTNGKSTLLLNADVIKCKNFLDTLIRVAEKKRPAPSAAVKAAIAQLLQGTRSSQAFAKQMEILLNSVTQAHLPEFLNKSLPALRVALQSRHLSIDGFIGLRIASEKVNLLNSSMTSRTVRAPMKLQFVKKDSNGLYSMMFTPVAVQQASPILSQRPLLPNLPRKSQPVVKRPDKSPCLEIFHTTQLLWHINEKMEASGMKEIGSSDVVKLVGESCKERLYHLLAEAIKTAGHRTDTYVMDTAFTPTYNVKSVLRFLTTMDKLEEAKYQEKDREMIYTILKRKSKPTNSRHYELFQRCKQKRQALEEEQQYKIANNTALAAIGSRKRKIEDVIGEDAKEQECGTNGTKKRLSVLQSLIKRTTVNLRDLQHVCERDQYLSKSRLLYKSYNLMKR